LEKRPYLSCLVEFDSGRDGSPSRPSNCVFLLNDVRQKKSDVLEKRPYLSCLVEFDSGRDGSPSRPSNCIFLLNDVRQDKPDVLEKRPYLTCVPLMRQLDAVYCRTIRRILSEPQTRFSSLRFAAKPKARTNSVTRRLRRRSLYLRVLIGSAVSGDCPSSSSCPITCICLRRLDRTRV